MKTPDYWDEGREDDTEPVVGFGPLCKYVYWCLRKRGLQLISLMISDGETHVD